ncbi:MAG: GNAT family N-acetyltransferase [Pseudomonadota bacterium]
MFFIRSATEADLPRVQALLKDSWMQTYVQYEGEEKIRLVSDEWHSLERLKAQLQQPRSEFIVADDGHTLGGMGYALQTDQTIAELKQLHVSCDVQGQGVGSDILSELETAFHGVTTLRLDAHPGNTSALAWYEKRGYRKYGEADQCGGEFDLPAVLMEKRLESWDI